MISRCIKKIFILYYKSSCQINNASWNLVCIYMLYCNPQYKMHTWFQIILQQDANLNRSIK